MAERPQRIIKRGAAAGAVTPFVAQVTELEALSGHERVPLSPPSLPGGDDGEGARLAPHPSADAARLADQAQAAAEAVREQAQIDARRLLAEAGVRAQLVEKEAFERGFRAGELEAREQSEAQLRPVLARFADSLERLATARREVFESCEHEILRLALAIARRVVHQEISVNEDVIASVAKAAIRHAIASEELVLRVNPADLAVLERIRPQLLALAEGPQTVRLVTSEQIERGGLVIESGYGDVDARIEEQLREVERALLEGEQTLRIADSGSVIAD